VRLSGDFWTNRARQHIVTVDHDIRHGAVRASPGSNVKQARLPDGRNRRPLMASVTIGETMWIRLDSSPKTLGHPYVPHVGDRVRVQHGVGGCLPCPNLPHFREEAGHVGKVVAVRAPANVSDHPFLVIFTNPAPLVRMIGNLLPLSARHYAADELELIDAD
jgi:hypothetical protein